MKPKKINPENSLGGSDRSHLNSYRYPVSSIMGNLSNHKEIHNLPLPTLDDLKSLSCSYCDSMPLAGYLKPNIGELNI